jgi:hypothetical protein
MSLPMPWIDKIFEKLTLTYGREFVSRWDNCGIPIADVKADWAHELDGFENHAYCIKHALSNLNPDKAPTVLQFKALCQKAPPPIFKSLPQPKPDPNRVKAEIAKLKSKFTTTKAHDHDQRQD